MPHVKIRAAVAAAGFLLLAPAALGDGLGWGRSTFLGNVARLAGQTDLRDAAITALALGVAVPLRPYCGAATCNGLAVLGMVYAFPEPPVALPASGGVTAQYYVADRTDPPGTDMPLVGTLAALDLFPPHGGFCLRRSDVRAALGPEASTGSPLGRGEPGAVALNYVAVEGTEYRTVELFVFAGPVAADGCLAFASVRQDNFGRNADAAARRAAFRPSADWPPFAQEEPVDTTSVRDLFDPAAGPLPLGLTLEAFATRHPECDLGEPASVERFSPLTDVAPAAIPLLPTHEGAYLATSHSARNTTLHGTGRVPAVAAELLASREVICRGPNPNGRSEYDRTVRQAYGVLVYEGRILVMTKRQNELWRGYLPPGFAAAEAVAQAQAQDAAVTMSVVPKQPDNPWLTERAVVIAFTTDGDLGTAVEAVGPQEMRGSAYLLPSNVTYAFVHMALWQSYADQARATITDVLHGKPAGLAEVCRPSECAGTAPSLPAHPAPPGLLLDAVKAIVAAGDLTDHSAFGRAMGAEAMLVRAGAVRNAVDGTRTIGPAQQASEVGLKPGPTLLDQLGFAYWIAPDGLNDGQTRLPSYRQKVAELSIGNYKLHSAVCITREDATAAFGANQRLLPGVGQSYVRKFDLIATRGHVIYFTLDFWDAETFPKEPNIQCARNLRLDQYRLVRNQ